jgi:hypothetical protein
MSLEFLTQNKNTSWRRKALVILCLLSIILPSIIINAADPIQPRHRKIPAIKPTIPTASRAAGNRIFLEHANELKKNEQDSFMIVVGDVKFSKGPMLMFCDSAHYYSQTESMDAFGNVHMEQGDTLFVYADELNYSGPEEVAYLYANADKKVRLINRDVKLETDEFVYDLGIDMGYYNVGGVLTDKKNKLYSIEGEYIPSTKEANFYSMVHLTSRGDKDTLEIYTDTLFYNTNTHVAELFSPSTILNGQATIYTTEGNYNTETNVADLYSRSKAVTKNGNTLVGDTLYYDRNAGYGEAFGNMVLVDSARQSTLMGDYGYYNELIDSAYVTGHALAMEYSRPDTLYIHGRQIKSFLRLDTINIPEDTLTNTPASFTIDSTHVVVAHPRVRFWRVDMQGLCDSLRFEERDSMLYMFTHPIVWNEERQIFGNVIQVHLNDSTIDWAKLPDFGFSAEHIDEEFYNQLSGKEMIAQFVDGKMTHLDVNGNVQVILLPEENDSTYNKLFNVESSFMSADFENQQLVRVKMWPETNSKGVPLFLAKKSMFYLPKFAWYEELRPSSPEDIFVIPEAMDKLLNSEEGSAVKNRQSKARKSNVDMTKPLENAEPALNSSPEDGKEPTPENADTPAQPEGVSEETTDNQSAQNQ